MVKQAARRRDWLSELLSFRGAVAFWVLYGLAHSLLRLSLTRTLALDDGRSNELVQNLALGYQVRQPPLYEWLLWCSQQLLGTGIESHLLVRYGLILGIGISTFYAVRAAVKDDRWAAAASISLAFSYPVGWTFHEWATQTLLLCIACMVTLHAAIRFLETPSARTSLWLGAAIGLGFYAKFSYPIYLGGVFLAALSMPETRRKLADARLLLAPLVAALLLSPYLVWLMQVNGSMVGEITRHIIQDTRSHIMRVGVGLNRFAVSLVAFPLPWLLFVAMLAPKAFWRAPASARKASVAEQLALRSMLFTTLLVAAGIIVTGTTIVRLPYMHVVLFVAPVYVFARVARLTRGEDIARNIVALSLTVALVVLGIRLVGAIESPLTRKLNRGISIDYRSIIDVLQQRGITDGTALSVEVRDGGNLRAVFPNLRIRGLDTFRTERAPRRPSDDRSCILVWRDDQEEDISRFDAGSFKPERIEPKTVPDGWIARRPVVWFLARLDPKSPACQ